MNTNNLLLLLPILVNSFFTSFPNPSFLHSRLLRPLHSDSEFKSETVSETVSGPHSGPTPPSPSPTPPPPAQTNTINNRLLAEISQQQQSPNPSSTSPPNPKRARKRALIKKTLSDYREGRPAPTSEERQQSITAAQDLNGVNPFICTFASLASFAGSTLCWKLTTALALFFSSLEQSLSPNYTVARLESVVKTVAVGGSSLAAGFCFVIGLGVGLLGLRVFYGVYIIKDLDMTAINMNDIIDQTKGGGKDQREKFELPNPIELMLGKKKM